MQTRGVRLAVIDIDYLKFVKPTDRYRGMRVYEIGEITGALKQLAKAEGVRHQSMRVTVASLEAMGVVSGEPDPSDGRQTIFSLTPAFLKILRTGRAAKEDWLFRALQAQLTPREQKELAAAVKFLQRLADF